MEPDPPVWPSDRFTPECSGHVRKHVKDWPPFDSYLRFRVAWAADVSKPDHVAMTETCASKVIQSKTERAPGGGSPCRRRGRPSVNSCPGDAQVASVFRLFTFSLHPRASLSVTIDVLQGDRQGLQAHMLRRPGSAIGTGGTDPAGVPLVSSGHEAQESLAIEAGPWRGHGRVPGHGPSRVCRRGVRGDNLRQRHRDIERSHPDSLQAAPDRGEGRGPARARLPHVVIRYDFGAARLASSWLPASQGLASSRIHACPADSRSLPPRSIE